jgi:putative FmdB family regulatory protein
MPFYEYECSACNHHVEVLQKISDEHLRKCPDCGKSALKRLISAPVFRLKGAGWYETDFKSDNEQKRNIAEREEGQDKADDKADSKDGKEAKDTKDTKDTPAEGKSESKPEAVKSEPKETARTQRKPVAQPQKAPAKASPASKAKPAPNKAKPKAKAKSKPAKKKAARR